MTSTCRSVKAKEVA